MASIKTIYKQSRQSVKTYLSEKYNLYVFFSEYGRLSVTEKPLLYNLRQKCHVNFKNER